ncbi:MAG: hypothetical protein WKF92_13370 [Pyrinomonadaceae bacterium]
MCQEIQYDKKLLSLILLITSYSTISPNKIHLAEDLAHTFSNESPVRVSICELAKDPTAYNQKLLEITGFISRGFEDSSLFDPTCATRFGIWVELGGTKKTGTIYCCGESSDRIRPKDLIVENISIPLVDNVPFRQFDKLLQREPDSIVRATMVGRFFSGKKEKFPGGEFWVGYGHMGMSSLFAIQQVVSVDPHDRNDLDYGASVDQPDNDYEGCGNYTIYEIKPQKTILKRNQRQKRNSGLGDSRIRNAWLLKVCWHF